MGAVYKAKQPKLDRLVAIYTDSLTKKRTQITGQAAQLASSLDAEMRDLELPDDIQGAIGISIGISDGIALLADGSVTAWGNTFSQSGKDPPPGLQNIVDTAITWGSSDNPSCGFAARRRWGGDGSNIFSIPADLPPIKEIEAGWNHLLCLARDGSVICLPGQNQRPVNPSDNLPPMTTTRARGIFFAGKDKDGVWLAWGHRQFGVVEKINDIGPAHQVAFKANRWRGVFWIEP